MGKKSTIDQLHQLSVEHTASDIDIELLSPCPGYLIVQLFKKDLTKHNGLISTDIGEISEWGEVVKNGGSDRFGQFDGDKGTIVLVPKVGGQLFREKGGEKYSLFHHSELGLSISIDQIKKIRDEKV